MATITESFDSLPYIDTEPLPQVRAQISTTLASQLPPESRKTLHPSIREIYEPKFSPLMQAELDRVAASQKLSAIDTSRYESLDAPEETDQSSETATQWKDALSKAYAAHAHLRLRQNNLSALEKHGKNAWLLGNYHLEQELKAIEKELVDTKTAIENVNKERKMAQDAVYGELSSLSETWEKGIGRALEVDIANEGLRMQILETQRRGAS